MSPRSRHNSGHATRHANQMRLVRRSLRERKQTSAWYAAPPPTTDSPTSTEVPGRGLVFRHDPNPSHPTPPTRSSYSPDTPSPEIDRRTNAEPVRTRLFHYDSSSSVHICHENIPDLSVCPNDQHSPAETGFLPPPSPLTPSSRKAQLCQSSPQSQPHPPTTPSLDSEKRLHRIRNNTQSLAPTLHRASLDPNRQLVDATSKRCESDITPIPESNLPKPSTANKELRHRQPQLVLESLSQHPTRSHNQNREKVRRHPHPSGVHDNQYESPHRSPPKLVGQSIVPIDEIHPDSNCKQAESRYPQAPFPSVKQQSPLSKANDSHTKIELTDQEKRISPRTGPLQTEFTAHVRKAFLPVDEAQPQIINDPEHDDNSEHSDGSSLVHAAATSINEDNFTPTFSGNFPHSDRVETLSPNALHLSRTPTAFEDDQNVFPGTPVPELGQEHSAEADILDSENLKLNSCIGIGVRDIQQSQPGNRALPPTHDSFTAHEMRNASPLLRTPLQPIHSNEYRTPPSSRSPGLTQAPHENTEARSATPRRKVRFLSQTKVDALTGTNDTPVESENCHPAPRKRSRLADITNSLRADTDRHAFDNDDSDATDNVRTAGLEYPGEVSITQGRFWLTRSVDVHRVLRQDLIFHNKLSFVITLDIQHAMFVAEVILSSRGSTGARRVLPGHTEIFVVGTLFTGILECTIHTTRLRLRRGDHLAISAGQIYRLDNRSISDCQLLYIEAALS